MPKRPDMTNSIATLALVSERTRKIPSRISGAFDRNSVTTNAPRRATASANRPSVRPDERGSEALESAAGDQEPRGAGKAVDEGGDREDGKSAHEEALTPEEVRRPAAEQQKASEEEGVDVDDPLQAGRRKMEAVLDRR